MVLLGDEDGEDQEVLVLSMDRWSQRRMLRKLMRMEILAGKLERAALTQSLRQCYVELQALAIALQSWLKEAIPPAGHIEVGEKEPPPG